MCLSLLGVDPSGAGSLRSEGDVCTETTMRVQDKRRSDSMTRACDIMELQGLMRHAVKILKGTRILLTGETFHVAAVSVIPVIKVAERYSTLPLRNSLTLPFESSCPYCALCTLFLVSLSTLGCCPESAKNQECSKASFLCSSNRMRYDARCRKFLLYTLRANTSIIHVYRYTQPFEGGVL